VAAATATMPASELVSAFSQSAPAKSVRATTEPRAEPADEALFDQALQGDREALGQLITRYEKTLFGLLVRMTGGDRHRADDLFQETFLHAMRAAATFNRKMQFKPWITAIAVNLIRDEARKRKVRGEVTLDGSSRGDEDQMRVAEPVSDGETPGEHAERKDEENYLRRALQKLTDLEREVVLLHFYNSMTLADTAAVLGVPLGTVKSRLHAALTRLNGMLERPGS
jgi:RNA polymerase sigma-70 factor (ECF subfamily)